MTISIKATAKQIRKNMDKHGYTNESLALELKRGVKTVSRWSAGTALPTIENFAMLAQVFGCGIDDLVCFGKEE